MILESYLPTVRKIKILVLQLSSYRTIGGLLYVTLLPIIFNSDRLVDIWRSGLPRAWDGTGHYGIAQIYAQSIFPDTFGWTNAHLGGMPFPNFYPPLFFWCVAPLAKVFSFLTAFKLMVTLPLLLIPVALWFLAWSLSGKDDRIAFWSVLYSTFVLASPVFAGQMKWASGLDYFSTLSIGMYTQPLGFVLLLAWYAVYVEAHRSRSRFILSSVLLALAVLGNYLNVFIVTIIVAATLVFDLTRLSRKDAGTDVRRILLAHFFTPLISLALTLFWVVPLLGTYDYFVTRPFSLVIVTTYMVVWFVVAGIGIVCWLGKRSSAANVHVATCLALAAILIFAAVAAPRWLPLQANRLAPILCYFLAIPVGYAVTTFYDEMKRFVLGRIPRLRPIVDRAAPVIIILILLFLLPYYYWLTQKASVKLFNEYQSRLAFYPRYTSDTAPPVKSTAPDDFSTISATLVQQRPADIANKDLFERLKEEHANGEAMANAAKVTLESILSFGRDHRDGRYAVEIPKQYRQDSASFDGRALNSYLGAQGNQTLTVVFREASANSIFMFPQVGAISYNPDNFGFSSVLGDDLDFAEQPLAKHLDRLRYLGARYLVINSDQIKERLAPDPAVGARYDFGTWSIFQLRDAAPPPVRQLAFRPALAVTSFTVKGRQANEYNYIRFAEEQFADGWFAVLLARASTTNLDNLGSLQELNQFSAIILETYDCERCDLVYRQLKEFAQTRLLIIFGNDSALFNRIRTSISDFPKATIIERNEQWMGPWLENYGASRRYGGSSERAVWVRIRNLLDRDKIPVEPANVQGEIDQNRIQINYDGPTRPIENSVPVLIATTLHPNWQRNDSEAVYAATPMFMLTFVRRPTSIVFARKPLEKAAVWMSFFTLAAMMGFIGWNGVRRLRPGARFPDLKREEQQE